MVQQRKKVFMDAEFTGLHQNTTLISIGLVDETGNREFYAEFNDYDETQVDKWLEDNVIRNLWLQPTDNNPLSTPISIESTFTRTNITGSTDMIREQLTKWFDSISREKNSIELVLDCYAYDFMLFNQIWGHAFNIPEQIFYVPTDISTMFQLIEGDSDMSRDMYASIPEPIQMSKHNALYDAIIIRDCYYKLMERYNWEMGNRHDKSDTYYRKTGPSTK